MCSTPVFSDKNLLALPTWQPRRLFDVVDPVTRYDQSQPVEPLIYRNPKSVSDFSARPRSLADLKRMYMCMHAESKNEIVRNNFVDRTLAQPNLHMVLPTGYFNYRRV